jgi:hypothetical protein
LGSKNSNAYYTLPVYIFLDGQSVTPDNSTLKLLIDFIRTNLINGKSISLAGDLSNTQLYRTAIAFKFYVNSKLSKPNVNIVADLLRQAFEKSNPSRLFL